ncbi:hypothetical protein [Rhodopirellula halodulae]|uniref:hypothetical protein n=1 Tax=Rhodopirellula halodulae TaxID=2894198 RepID=UPI001E5C3450|nr:hypothetical protein [Rhodopirellula sp. JC737]MCC9655498.1 hypothetical protein [Rhodopirellula sp. JC737]
MKLLQTLLAEFHANSMKIRGRQIRTQREFSFQRGADNVDEHVWHYTTRMPASLRL